MASSEGYHEPIEQLPALTRDMHRALLSLREELDAVDWYQQRVDAADDEELKRVLAHNRDEEKEHAAMVLEWIQRHDPAFATHLRTYLFRQGDIVAIEAATENGESPAQAQVQAATIAPTPTLTIGSLMQGVADQEGP